MPRETDRTSNVCECVQCACVTAWWQHKSEETIYVQSKRPTCVKRSRMARTVLNWIVKYLCRTVIIIIIIVTYLHAILIDDGEMLLECKLTHILTAIAGPLFTSISENISLLRECRIPPQNLHRYAATASSWFRWIATNMRIAHSYRSHTQAQHTHETKTNLNICMMYFGEREKVKAEEFQVVLWTVVSWCNEPTTANFSVMRTIFVLHGIFDTTNKCSLSPRIFLPKPIFEFFFILALYLFNKNTMRHDDPVNYQ